GHLRVQHQRRHRPGAPRLGDPQRDVPAGADARAAAGLKATRAPGQTAWPTRRALALPVHGADVGLHGIVGRVRRVGGGHHSFEPVPLRGVAVVAAGAEADGALFSHGVVVRARPVTVERPRRYEDAGLGVALLDGPVILAGGIALHHAGDVRPAGDRQV